MVDMLLECRRRRDYRLKIIFGCRSCNYKYVTIFLHRTEEDIKQNRRNIKQVCDNCRAITKPFKECTTCKRTYEIEDSDCPECEAEILIITERELALEEAQKHRRVEDIRIIGDEIEKLKKHRQNKKGLPI